MRIFFLCLYSSTFHPVLSSDVSGICLVSRPLKAGYNPIVKSYSDGRSDSAKSDISKYKAFHTLSESCPGVDYSYDKCGLSKEEGPQ